MKNAFVRFYKTLIYNLITNFTFIVFITYLMFHPDYYLLVYLNI